jgi:hypothetical protein
LEILLIRSVSSQYLQEKCAGQVFQDVSKATTGTVESTSGFLNIHPYSRRWRHMHYVGLLV